MSWDMLDLVFCQYSLASQVGTSWDIPGCPGYSGTRWSWYSVSAAWLVKLGHPGISLDVLGISGTRWSWYSVSAAWLVKLGHPGISLDVLGHVGLGILSVQLG